MTTELTAVDRCDRCGAQAYHRFTFAAGELLFCNHHWREHQDRLPQTTPAALSGQTWRVGDDYLKAPA